MHSKVIIVVNRFHWCCVSCQLVNKHVVSVDEHLKSCHFSLLSSTSATSPCLSSDFELDDFSDLNFDFCRELNERTIKEQLSDDVLVPGPVQKKETTCHKKRGKTHSQSKSRTSNSSRPSAGMPESEPSEVLSSCPPKNRRSLNRLAANGKESKSHHFNSDVSSIGKPVPGTAEEQPAGEYRPLRKRPRLQSFNKDAHEENEHHAHNNQTEVADTGTSKENLKSSVDNVRTDSKAAMPKSTTRGRPKRPVKPKETFRKKLKTVDREMKKYCWGGKPVKRSLEVAGQEMKRLKFYYIGSVKSRISNDTDLNEPFVQKGDDICRVGGEEPTPLSSFQANSGLHIAVECTPDVLDSAASENDLIIQTTNKTQVSLDETVVPAMHGKHAGVTEAYRTEINTVNRSDQNEKNESTFNDHLNVSFPSEASSEKSPQSVPHDIHQPCTGSNLHRGAEIITQTPSVAQEHLHPPRQCTPVCGQDTPTPAMHTCMLPGTDMSNAHNKDSFKNTSDIYSVSAQQDASKVTETVESDHCSLEEHGQTTDFEEWVKSRTNFSFSKPKKSLCLEHPSKVYECTVCQAKFSTGDYLSEHVSKMSVHEQSTCQSCQRLFHSAYDLNFHVFEDHERRVEPFCFNCKEKFKDMAALEEHLHRHKYNHDPDLLDMEYHSCSICQADIPCRYETLRKHYNKHKRTICLECFVRSKLILLPDATSVREHKKVHSNFCSVCIQDFASVDAMNAHYPCQSEDMNREDGQGIVCERCNKWCPNKALATLHHKEHKLQVMRKWRVEKWGTGIACVHCDKILRNKRNLERHVAQLHSSCRSYNFHCEFCGKGIDSKNILKDHIAVHHLGIKRYRCEYCDQRFACAPTLRRHVLKEHATDRQYSCEVCGERFCEKFKLTKHMYVHTGSARFMCEQCGKGFHSRSEFKKHLAVHEEKRSFACQVCGQEYKRKEHLKRHVLKCRGSVPGNAHVVTDISHLAL